MPTMGLVNFRFVGLWVFTRAMLASVGISCCHVSVHPSVSVRPSVTGWCSIETARHRITQSMPHDSPGTLVFSCWKSLQNSNGVTPNGGTKYRWGRLNAVAVAEICALSFCQLGCRFITLSIHVTCLQHVHRDLPWCSAKNRPRNDL